MTCTLYVAWDERLVDYHFGPGHPLAPVRVELTMQLAHQFGLWNQPGVTVATPAPASDADLLLIHDPSYVMVVEAVSRWAARPDARRRLVIVSVITDSKHYTGPAGADRGAAAETGALPERRSARS